VSDLGFLRGTISVQSSTSESAFAELNRQKPILISYLDRKGFPKDKVEFFTINSYPVFEMSNQGYQTGRVIGYVYSQRIEIQSTDRDLGPMRSARMGVLQITPKFSNAISDYGINDLSSIEKEIIGVVNASFEIE
ncbi:MAG: SIMPL domain-containing protein, partial [Ignavibacteria bacterium]|nr:SIMPL domain-containing protein [Ignavibacteria bacterium]